MSANWRKWEWRGVYDLSGSDALGTELRTLEEDACERSIVELPAIVDESKRLISFMSVDNLLDMKMFCRGISPVPPQLFAERPVPLLAIIFSAVKQGSRFLDTY